MKLLITALVILAVVYGVYNFTMAAYGWFQMASIVDEVTKEEMAKPGGGGFTAFDGRGGRIREKILKGAKDASVEIRPEDVNINVVDGMLDVRLTWAAPMIRYQGTSYLDIPMTLQRGFPLKSQ